MKCSELLRLVSGVLKPEEVPGNAIPEDGEPAPLIPPNRIQPIERSLRAMETAVRSLIPLGILYDQAGTDLRAFPLTEESRFPLPLRFVSAAVYLTGYLLDGETRLFELYSAECESIRREIPAEIMPTVQVYG